MTLEEVLKKESIGEKELKVLSANLHNLTHAQKVRYGFEVAPVVEEPVVAPKAKTTTRRKKVV